MNLNLEIIEMPERLRKWAEQQEEHQARHIGTHIDVYYTSTIEESLKECRGVVIDIREIKKIGCKVMAGVQIQKGDFVIFRTGYMEKFGYGSREYLDIENAPHMTDELVDYLIGGGVKFIGIDLHGIQHGKDHKKIDQYTEAKGTYVVENITNLDKIPDIVNLRLNWDQLEGATAVPVRIAVINI